MSVGQTEFRTAILDPQAVVPEGLIDPEGRPAGKRFDVYRNNVVVSLTTALAEAFPVINKLLGSNNFGILAGAFVRQHPPETPVIALYGASMPAFLTNFEPVRHLGYLPDIARLELAIRTSYHAADSAEFAPESLQSLSADQLNAARFALAPSMELVASDWPIVSIWRFNMQDGPKPGMIAETALITRPAFDPSIEALPPAGGIFVQALAQGHPLGAAFEAAAASDPGFDLSPILGALITGGAITAIQEEPAP